MNNLKVFTITDAEFSPGFGLTDNEVKQMLGYYELDDKYSVIKEWYDGYRFGKEDVYCPWDVISYVDSRLKTRDMSNVCMKTE